MSKLLINESPLQVQPTLAKLIGLNEAIFLQQLHYWLGASKFIRNEKKWIYNTYAEWVDQLKYISISTLKRTIKSLKEQGLLCVEQFDNKRSNQVNYYAINYDILAEIEQNDKQVIDSIDKVKMNQCIGSEWTNASAQNEPMDEVKMNQSSLGQNEPIYNTREYQETTQEITKSKNKKNSKTSYDPKLTELPNSIDRDLWNQFVEMRTSIKKPLTENAVKLILKKLESFGVLANQSLENSIIGSYQGVYPPKPETHSNQFQNSNTPEEPSYFAQIFQNQQQSNVIDVTPDYENLAVAGGVYRE
ncbi:hypothetical protein [Acinetobacter sp. Marseille-Q1618]|uniref:hypothetical protein n=1 Tax=Acinetobacter sp. Marseille-Q1618 TaxID=2697502 RepID=UPI0015704E84|nr:hypothetical protein [Acinetobacter sp. Marseille-Q1618]